MSRQVIDKCRLVCIGSLHCMIHQNMFRILLLLWSTWSPALLSSHTQLENAQMGVFFILNASAVKAVPAGMTYVRERKGRLKAGARQVLWPHAWRKHGLPPLTRKFAEPARIRHGCARTSAERGHISTYTFLASTLCTVWNSCRHLGNSHWRHVNSTVSL